MIKKLNQNKSAGILSQQNVTREDNIAFDIRDHLGMCNYKGSYNVIAILHLWSHQKDKNPSSMYSHDTVGCCCLRKKRVTYHLTSTISCLC